MNTPSRTTRLILSSEPRCCLAAARALNASRIGSIASSIHVEFFPKPANILWLVVDNWKHSAQEEQIACL